MLFSCVSESPCRAGDSVQTQRFFKLQSVQLCASHLVTKRAAAIGRQPPRKGLLANAAMELPVDAHEAVCLLVVAAVVGGAPRGVVARRLVCKCARGTGARNGP